MLGIQRAERGSTVNQRRQTGVHGRSPVIPAVLLGLAVLCIYLATGSSDLRHNGDTDLRYQVTEAVVEHGRLWIADPIATGTRVAIGLGGKYYVSAYGPGQTVFMIPLYLAGRAAAVLLSLPVTTTTLYAARSLDLFLGGFLAAAFFLLAVSMGMTRTVAAVLTLVFAFATPAWPDAQSALEHTQVSLFVLVAVSCAWRYVRAGRERPRWLWLSGVAGGVALFTRYDAVIFLAVIAVWIVAPRIRTGDLAGGLREALVFGGGIAPWVIMLLVWNQLRFGSPFNVALHLQTFGEPPWVALPGLLISPGKGIVWYAPLVVLLAWAAPRLRRRLPALFWLYAGLVLVALGFYSTVLYWHGDPAWGPRYLYPVLPYLVLPLGELAHRERRARPGAVALGLALLALSVGLQVAAVSVTQWRFWYQLEVIQERTPDKFNWGPTAYTYYWDVTRSPIVLQVRNLYQVAALDALGRRRYLLTRRPTACTGPRRCLDNPARNYALNTPAFWWADTRHPLLAGWVRLALAAALGLGGLLAGAAGVRRARQDDAVLTRVRGPHAPP